MHANGTYRIDIALCALLGLAGFLIPLALGLQLPEVVFLAYDQYYGSDIVQSHHYMSGEEVGPAHLRTSVHPIFSFLVIPPTTILMQLGLPSTTAAAVIVALTGLATCCMVYAFGRVAGISPVDAALLTAVFLASGAFLHWWSVPETYPFGGMSVMFACLAAVIPGVSRIGWVAVAALTLSFTTTNWIAGILAAAQRLSRRDVVVVVVASFVVVAILSLWQKTFIRTAQFFFLPDAVLDEVQHLAAVKVEEHQVGFSDRVVSFVANPWVVPAPVLTESHGIRPDHLAYGPLGWIALIAIGLVAACALWNLWRTPGLRPFVVVPALFLAFQFVLHLVYGDEPFLYSAHFVPAMICVLALGFLGAGAMLCRAAAVVFVAGAGVTNVSAYLAAMAVLETVVLS
jgi:hypothetical protein